MIEYPTFPLNHLITQLESGSRPQGGASDDAEGIPSLGGEHVTSDGTIRFLRRKFVPQSHFEQMTRGVVRAGDVLVVKDGATTGKTALFPNNFPFPDVAINEHVFLLRTRSNLLSPAYLAAFLNSGFGQLQILKTFQGAAIGGIKQTFTNAVKVPLPPLSEQQQIAEILQEAQELRRLRGEAEVKTSELTPAIFSTIFDDLYFGKSPFPVQSLSSIGELDRGKSKHRPRDEPSLYNGPYPFIQTGDVAQADGWITSFSQTYSEKGLEQSRLWPADTLAITIAANIGATAILTFDACFPDSIVGFTPNDGISVEYVRWWLLGYQKKLEIQASQGAQKNINLEVLRSTKIPVPPKELQATFKAAIHNLREQFDLGVAGAKSLAALSASLSAHAFSGQLTADWREKHRVTLASEVRKRDAELAILSGRPVIVNFSTADARLEADAFNVPDELNREQKALLTLSKIRQLKRATERKRATVDYFTAELLAAELDGPLRRNPHAIEAHLAVFAARGLIIPVSREEQTEDTGEYVFGNAYRFPIGDKESLAADEQSYRATVGTGEEVISERIPGDFSRLREMERLVIQLEKERMLT